MDLKLKKHLNDILQSIIWNNDYFDKHHNKTNCFVGEKYSIEFDHSPSLKNKFHKWIFIPHIVTMEHKIRIWKNSSIDDKPILILDLYESELFWKKFALRLSRFERARKTYKALESDRNVCKVIEAEYVVPTMSRLPGEYGTHVPLNRENNAIILDEAELAHHLLIIK